MLNLSKINTIGINSFLINISKGKIVEQKNLKTFLVRNIIAAATLDVNEEEPLNYREFLKLPNLKCMLHIGGSPREALNNMGLAATNNLIKIMK